MEKTSFEDLYNLVIKYIHNEESLNLIKKAYDLAYNLHNGQLRKSGEPYIIHPLNVACILATLNVGPATLCAGLLHDVVEDTACSKEELAKEFGQDVAEIVDGVTKLEKLQFVSLEQKQVENHQHMLLAMAKDIRVIVVKLADRLHNIRTLGSSAIGCAYAASGKLDIFMGRFLKPWDYAAGMIIIKEAGGKLTDLSGGMDITNKCQHIVASNSKVHNKFLNLINK